MTAPRPILAVFLDQTDNLHLVFSDPWGYFGVGNFYNKNYYRSHSKVTWAYGWYDLPSFEDAVKEIERKHGPVIDVSWRFPDLMAEAV